jgi:trimeric autotransporter adhesin
MAVKFSNNATTTLASSINSTQTTITVTDASKFPTLGAGDYTYVTLDADAVPAVREIVKVTAITGNVFTVVRGQDGTSAASFDAGVFIELRLTAALLNDVADLPLSVSTTTASGGGTLAYSAGVFTFAPADLSSYATQTYVNTAVANLVDSAPATLDTLNELAAALGDDANFSTTVTNSIATKWTQDNTKISNWDTAYSWGDHSSVGYIIDLSSFTTTDLAEGTNLYYTNERVDDRVSTLIVPGLGITTDYDDTAGTLTIDSDTIEELCKNGTGSTILKGTPVYQTGTAGNAMVIAPADASSAATMPAVGVLSQDLAAAAEGSLILMGRISGVDTSAFSEGDVIYVASGGGYTNVRPTGQSILVQNLGRVTKVHASNGGGVIMGAGRSNDVPNLTDGNIFIGNASGTYDKRAIVTADISDLTATATELNYTDGVTSNIQTQLDSKAPLASPTFTGTVTSDGYTLEEIALSKAVTAVDVFVYDTRKDSDGGAWRKRTQNTSWYNETLDTATRGSRKEFPAVAVIVSSSASVTIYDGDDPSLPMWMVFNSASGTILRVASGLYSISMLNGILVLGSANTGQYSLETVRFIEDKTQLVGTSVYNWTNNTVVDRNASGALINIGAAGAIVNNIVKDVAMTVLPNAPIDAATGLPVPTIAVATGAGISVINNDGTVADGVNLTNYSFVGFNDNYELGFLDVSFAHDFGVIENYDADGFTYSRIYYTSTIPRLKNSNFTSGAAYLASPSKNTAIGGTVALELLSEVPNSPNTGMLTDITTTYNTGWMVGYIKGAFLSDTDDTNIINGGELIPDGTFDGASLDPAWVIPAGSAAAINTSETWLEVTDDTGGDVYIPINVEVGQLYRLNVTFLKSGGGRAAIGNDTEFVQGTSYTYFTATGTYVRTFTPTQSVIYFVVSSAGTDLQRIDNLSVQAAELDRSYNNDPLLVNGTITKTPVATGADLVGYSGFSTSNYLEQPYNSDLNFGTGDFSIMGWVKEAAGGDWLIDRMEGRDGSSNLWGFDIWQEAQSLRFGLYENNGVTSVTSTIAMGSNDGVWNFFTAVRRSGVLEMYMHGKLAATTSGTARNISYTSTGNPPPLTIGAKNTGDSAWVDGSAALIRISATAPTAEQIAKIYNDEKFLFQENSQATLYGSANSVTALAYDDDTELLHVGTSAGRSVFQGLRRVDNTTDAVGASISASNGLIAED